MSLIDCVPPNGAVLIGVNQNENKKQSKPHYLLCRDKETAEELVAQYNAQGYGTHYALASFDRSVLDGKLTDRIYYPSRLTPIEVRCFNLDLDVGPNTSRYSFKYPTLQDAFAAANQAVDSGKIPAPTHIFRSGSGVYLYFVLDDSLPVTEWHLLRERLMYAINDSGLLVDPGSSSSAITMQRAPYGNNYKTGAPVPTVWVRNNGVSYTAESFSAVLPNVEVVQHRNQADTNIQVVQWDVIQRACPRVASMAQHGLSTYAEWFSFAQVAHYIEDGATIFKQLSAKHPDKYSEYATQEKFDEVGRKALSGPTSCEKFGPSQQAPMCQSCALRPYVRNPVDAARKVGKELEQLDLIDRTPKAVTESTRLGIAAPGTTVADLVREHHERNNTSPVSLTTPPSPTSVDALLEAVVNTEQRKATDKELDQTFVIEHDTLFFYHLVSGGRPPARPILRKLRVLDGVPTPKLLCVSELERQYGVQFERHGRTCIFLMGRQQTFTDFLEAKFGIAVHEPKYAKVWLTKYVSEAQRAGRVAIAYEQTGIKTDGSMLTTNGLLNADGTITEIADIVAPDEFRQALTRYTGKSGTLAEWERIIASYRRVGDIPLLVPTLLAIATPLVTAVTSQRINNIYSLCGSSGSGKTTAMRFAMSVWGAARDAHMTASTSVVTTIRKCGELNNHLAIVDEVTRLDHKIAEQFVFDFTGGSEKDRSANTGHGGKLPLEFNGIMCVTTNNSLIKKLASLGTDVSGSTSRITEIVQGVADPFALPLFADAEESLEENYGVVGRELLIRMADPAYRKHVGDLYEQFRKRFASEFRSESARSQSGRFKVTLAAMALTGHVLATEIMVKFPFTSDEVSFHMIKSLSAAVEEAQHSIDAAIMTAEEFINELNNMIVPFEALDNLQHRPDFEMTRHLIFYNNRLWFTRRAMQDARFQTPQIKVLLARWVEQGHLEVSGTRQQKRFPRKMPAKYGSGGRRPAMYCLSPTTVAAALGQPALTLLSSSSSDVDIAADHDADAQDQATEK